MTEHVTFMFSEAHRGRGYDTRFAHRSLLGEGEIGLRAAAYCVVLTQKDVLH